MLVVEQGEDRARLGEVKISETICNNINTWSKLGMGITKSDFSTLEKIVKTNTANIHLIKAKLDGLNENTSIMDIENETKGESLNVEEFTLLAINKYTEKEENNWV